MDLSPETKLEIAQALLEETQAELKLAEIESNKAAQAFAIARVKAEIWHESDEIADLVSSAGAELDFYQNQVEDKLWQIKCIQDYIASLKKA